MCISILKNNRNTQYPCFILTFKTGKNSPKQVFRFYCAVCGILRSYYRVNVLSIFEVIKKVTLALVLQVKLNKLFFITVTAKYDVVRNIDTASYRDATALLDKLTGCRLVGNVCLQVGDFNAMIMDVPRHSIWA